MSDIHHSSIVNVRSQSYLVARSRIRCWHCGLRTGLLALAMPGGHEILSNDSLSDVDDSNDADAAHESSSDAWQRESAHAILFYVAFLPVDLEVRLRTVSEHYRLVYSETTQDTYWANHCEHCGLLLEDHELHCEPEGAFVPASESAAANIQLAHIAQRFEAAAIGYSLDPEFFPFMSLL